MVERFVAVDQFFELLDDLQLGPVIGFFLLVQTGHVLVPLAAVLGEQLLEALFGHVSVGGTNCSIRPPDSTNCRRNCSVSLRYIL